MPIDPKAYADGLTEVLYNPGTHIFAIWALAIWSRIGWLGRRMTKMEDAFGKLPCTPIIKSEPPPEPPGLKEMVHHGCKDG